MGLTKTQTPAVDMRLQNALGNFQFPAEQVGNTVLAASDNELWLLVKVELIRH